MERKVSRFNGSKATLNAALTGLTFQLTLRREARPERRMSIRYNDEASLIRSRAAGDLSPDAGLALRMAILPDYGDQSLSSMVISVERDNIMLLFPVWGRVDTSSDISVVNRSVLERANLIDEIVSTDEIVELQYVWGQGQFRAQGKLKLHWLVAKTSQWHPTEFFVREHALYDVLLGTQHIDEAPFQTARPEDLLSLRMHSQLETLSSEESGKVASP